MRAVEMRPGTTAGRKITHHALAHLVQDDPDARKFSDPVGNGGRSPNEAGTLMEWAIGKNYDIYREGTGKLLLPGSHIWWDIHYHAVGEEHSRSMSSSACGCIPKAKSRSIEPI